MKWSRTFYKFKRLNALQAAFVCGVSLISCLAVSAQDTSVRAWEETITMPTYLHGAPETSPVFDRDLSYQRARRSVYPYLYDDNMAIRRADVAHHVVMMENEYVKLCIMPEIGGRLAWAVDKTNGYDIFYHQHVIKPANVGMLGAWISGGVEWNVFHHHRATTNLPVNYRIERGEDGSQTVWLGETEWRHRMQWTLGVTLRPGRSYIEVTGRLINDTPDDNSMLYWSNVSTKVDSTYQIWFPRSTHFVTYHAKNSMAHWPVTHETFNGIDLYKNNVDASWWKNHWFSNSMFVFNQHEDYIAGYDHGRDAGTLLTADHHINPGGKFWLWGPNSKWDTKILTDSDGHYIELMMGAYSDNQPDYNWSLPYETKSFTQYYYGLQKMPQVARASKEAALGLDDLGNGRYKVGLNVTSPRRGVQIEATSDGKVIYQHKLDISPDKPFASEVNLGSVVKDKAKSTVSWTVKDGDGQLLLSYVPEAPHDPNEPLPPIVKKPLRPAEIKNTEECYLVGLRNLQFHNPFIHPEDYFLEVLRRDSGDTRANTTMGVLCRERGLWNESAKYLRRAIKRQTKDYTRPRDTEALYNLGLMLKQTGDSVAALDTLMRATWTLTYNSPANFQVAQLYTANGDYDKAMERLDEAILNNGANFEAQNLRATLWRIAGKNDQAREQLNRVLEKDPLNVYALYEKDKTDGSAESSKLLGDDPEKHLELALKYIHNGFPTEGENLLKRFDEKNAYPTVKMWLAYLNDLRGNKNEAQRLYEAALSLPVEGCNPFRLETLPVLEKAKQYVPQSEKPWYYEGCLLYNKQQDNAARQWERCVEINPKMDLAWRNLGWYHWLSDKDYAKSAECYAKATQLAPSKALYLEEQDQVLEAKGEDVSKRYQILKKNHKTSVKRYYPLAQEVVTGTYVGDYDYVLRLLRDCYFPTREGVANFHDIYVDAVLMAGRDALQKGRAGKAVELYQKAFEYPENHQVFLVDERTPRDAQIYAFMAEAYQKQGKTAQADETWRKAAAVKTGKTDYRYWQALALRHLGRTADADALLKALVEEGKNGVVDHVVNFYGTEGATGQTVEGVNAKAYFTEGLGELGLGNKARAKELFSKTRQLKYDHLWAKVMLNDLQK